MPRGFIFAFAAFVALGLGYVVYIFVTQWQYQSVGQFQVRRNKITGGVQILNGKDWQTPFDNDNYAQGIDESTLKTAQIADVTWGEDGVLCGIARTGAKPLVGRLAVQIIQLDALRKPVAHERSLRRTVNWPANTETPFVIFTGQETPTRKDVKTVLRLETMYNSETLGAAR